MQETLAMLKALNFSDKSLDAGKGRSAQEVFAGLRAKGKPCPFPQGRAEKLGGARCRQPVWRGRQASLEAMHNIFEVCIEICFHRCRKRAAKKRAFRLPGYRAHSDAVYATDPADLGH